MFISELRDALTELLRERVRNGVITERSLARQIGMSQPHLHNVLKGTRVLGAEMIDRCLHQLRLSVLDLVDRSALVSYFDREQGCESPCAWLPILAGSFGPTFAWPTEVDTRERFPVPEQIVRGMWHPVIGRTAFDPRMSRTFAEGDYMVLDQSMRARLESFDDGLYAIKLGRGGLIRRLRKSGSSVYMVTDDTLNRPGLWERLPATDAQLLHFVRARATLIVRERDWIVPCEAS